MAFDLPELQAALRLTSVQIDQIQQYSHLLASKAGVLGLIGFSEGEILDEIVRGLLLAPLVTSTVADVGSGAGLPGVPLAISGKTVVAVEPKRRAAGFLELIARELALPLSVDGRPAEVVARSSRESFASVCCRALAHPPTALELCAPLCRPGGVIVITALSDADPLRVPPRVQESLGLGEARLATLNFQDIHQVVHIVQKLSPAGAGFPRREGLARNRPLF